VDDNANFHFNLARSIKPPKNFIRSDTLKDFRHRDSFKRVYGMKPSKHSGELAGAILEDSRRQAIDAAKKRAVAQQADYDTFKKLVRTHYRIHKRKAMDGFAAEELMNALCSSSACMLISLSSARWQVSAAILQVFRFGRPPCVDSHCTSVGSHFSIAECTTFFLQWCVCWAMNMNARTNKQAVVSMQLNMPIFISGSI
jgi:hypothetical protein